MMANEYLSQLITMDNAINRKQQRLMTLRDVAMNTTPNYSGETVQHTRNKNPLENIMTKIAVYFYKMVYAFLVTCIILYHFCCNSIHSYQSSNGLILYVTPIFLQISAHSFSSSSVSVVETVESTTSFT